MSNRLAEVSFTIFFLRFPGTDSQKLSNHSYTFTLVYSTEQTGEMSETATLTVWIYLKQTCSHPSLLQTDPFQQSRSPSVFFLLLRFFFPRRLYDKTTMLEPATKVDHVSVGVDFGYATEKEKKKDRMHRISRIASIPEIKEKTGLNGQVVSIKQPVEMTATRRDRSAQNKVRFESSLSWCD